jgi:hypothetical protein
MISKEKFNTTEIPSGPAAKCHPSLALRYKHGLFRQSIDKDGQHEEPENWLEVRNTLLLASFFWCCSRQL